MVGRRVRRQRRWRRAVAVLEEFEEACSTSVGRLRQVVDAMAVEMHAGLASEGGSKLKMLLTYVDKLPNGSAIPDPDVERKPIPQNLKTSTGEELFDLIASSLKEFIEKKEGVHELSAVKRRELGFTFSFPVKQMSVSSGILIKWTKGFAIEDMVGRDVSECLQQTMSKKGVNMGVAALVVNMEWGNFWSSHLPRTSYDTDLDADSLNPNDQGFEKMISAMYLGDIVRRVLLRMSQESDIFGPVASKLSVPSVLSTEHMAAMHEDDSPDLKEVVRILNDVLEIRCPSKSSEACCEGMRCGDCRAARLASSGIVVILKKIGRDGSGGITSGRIKSGSHSKIRRTVVAIEGGLYTGYLMFREYLNEAMTEILGEDVAAHVILRITKDGPGIGSALLAALYSIFQCGYRTVAIDTIPLYINIAPVNYRICFQYFLLLAIYIRKERLCKWFMY
ncbi:Hexokinase-3 [Camellia lanceoleosa]|uniref:Hexokinase-3 n=1 Tax=Camellia lanceoleosa TaxID=1840588 RepID=A0ACC0FY22_9ERIC|nr:Hexokinase-3 [Camellia lanceoleosa]